MRSLRSVATTMGFSALDGLMMGTRPVSIDPGVLLHLLEHERCTPQTLADLCCHRAGLLGVSGESADLRVPPRHRGIECVLTQINGVGARLREAVSHTAGTLPCNF